MTELEKNIIGAIIQDPGCLDDLPLREKHFATANAKMVFGIIQRLSKEGKPVDLVSVGQEAVKSGLKPELITDAVGSVFSAQKVNYHTALLIENYLRRSTKQHLTETAKNINKGDIFQQINDLQKKLDDEIQEIELQTDDRTLGERIMEVYEEIKNPKERQGLHFRRFPTIDKQIGGVMETDMIGIFGKDKSTKTTLGQSMVLDLVSQGYPAAIFTFEWAFIQVAWKTISLELGIDFMMLRNPKLMDNATKYELEGHIAKLKDYDLFVIDKPMDEIQIYNKIKRLKRKAGIKIAMIDYLMLVESSRKYPSLRERLNEMSRFFKRTALDLRVPIILINQANETGERSA
ncbi:MAG: hypothetical protein D6732_22625, partial [Methanobacteriota archaeon]